MLFAQQVWLLLLFAPAAMAAVGDGGRVNTFANPKIKMFSGNDVLHITTWEEAKQFCRSQKDHRWLPHRSEVCNTVARRNPTFENMATGSVTGLKDDDQWVPIRDGGQHNHWMQIGHLNNGTSTKGTCQTYRTLHGIASPKEQLAELSAEPEAEPIVYCKKPDGCTGNTCVFECPHKEGYYPDPTDCRAYCYCSGGGDEASKWERVTGTGLVWNPYCADSNQLTNKNAPLSGMTGGCPQSEDYITGQEYCTLGASSKARRDLLQAESQQLSLRGGSRGIGGRALEEQEYQFDYDNRPEWGYLPYKYSGETNTLVCSALPRAPELPTKCGSMWGDPHIVTFDGLTYDVQGTGEYVLAKSLKSKLELQVGMDKFGDKPLQATVARKVFFRTPDDSEPNLEIRYSSSRCHIEYLLDGEAVDMDSDWGRHGTLASGTEKLQYYVSRHDRYFYYPGSKISLHIRKKHSDAMGCYMNVKICLPDDITENETIVGLFGSPNGDASDDWMDPDGKNLDHQGSVDWADGFNYGTNTWCCKEKTDSLFDSPMVCNPDECCNEEYNDDLERAVMGAPEELRSVCGFDVACLTEGTAGDISDSTDSVRELKEAYGVDIIPEEKVTDPDVEEEDEVFQETSVKPAPEGPSSEEDTCPSKQPIPGSPCSFTDECYFGKDTCCGVTHAKFTANCFQGKVVAYYNDACMNPQCDTCPEEQPQPSDTCSFTGQCDYGEDTCCGQTHPQYTATCAEGVVMAYYNDACLNPQCDGPTKGGSYGDPHVMTWGGDQFDFHGACDLVLVDSPSFDHGKGLTVHIRTKIVTWWSYIDSAVVKIGDDTLEVQGGTNVAHYWINGVQGNITESADLDSKIGGYPIKFKKFSNKETNFRIMNLPSGHAVSLETFNDFVRVNIRADNKKQFSGALGLMGAYPTGAKVSRDGTTVMDNTDTFGQEWQVRANEEKLFHNLEGPQHPEGCIMPTTTEKKKRRLGEVMLTEDEAAQACARVSEEYTDACIFDVLATNSMDMAGSY